MNRTYLNSIIRSSLAAASAALTMLDQEAEATTTKQPAVIETGACAAVMGACEQYKPVVETVMEKTPFNKLMDELNDPRYTLRTYTELSQKTGIAVDFIEDALRNNDVEYVNKIRTRDGAKLIGLESRN